MRPGDAPSDDGSAEKRFAYLYTIVRTNAYAPGVNSARTLSCQARVYFKANTLVFGSFYKTLVINRLYKTTSQNILFHITEKAVPHVRKARSACPKRLFRDARQAFPWPYKGFSAVRKLLFRSVILPTLPRKTVLWCREWHFSAFHDAFIRHSVFCFTIFNCQDFLLPFLYFYA